MIVALLILLVSPKSDGGRAVGFLRRCPVCDQRRISKGSYCSECGSKV